MLAENEGRVRGPCAAAEASMDGSSFVTGPAGPGCFRRLVTKRSGRSGAQIIGHQEMSRGFGDAICAAGAERGLSSAGRPSRSPKHCRPCIEAGITRSGPSDEGARPCRSTSLYLPYNYDGCPDLRLASESLFGFHHHFRSWLPDAKRELFGSHFDVMARAWRRV